MMKIYLSHAVDAAVDFVDALRVTESLARLGCEVHTPIDILDDDEPHTRTPITAFNQTMTSIHEADIAVVRYETALNTHTAFDIGVLLGLVQNGHTKPKVFVYTRFTNELHDLLQDHTPQRLHARRAIGGIAQHFTMCANEQDMLAQVEAYINEQNDLS